MDFELPGEDHPKRRAIRAWFDANPHPSGLALAQAGFVVPHWPKPWGLEADAAQSRRHQQLRAVATDARDRGAAPAFPVGGAVGRAHLVHAVQRAVGRF